MLAVTASRRIFAGAAVRRRALPPPSSDPDRESGSRHRVALESMAKTHTGHWFTVGSCVQAARRRVLFQSADVRRRRRSRSTPPAKRALRRPGASRELHRGAAPWHLCIAERTDSSGRHLLCTPLLGTASDRRGGRVAPRPARHVSFCLGYAADRPPSFSALTNGTVGRMLRLARIWSRTLPSSGCSAAGSARRMPMTLARAIVREWVMTLKSTTRDALLGRVNLVDAAVAAFVLVLIIRIAYRNVPSVSIAPAHGLPRSRACQSRWRSGDSRVDSRLSAKLKVARFGVPPDVCARR